MSKDCNHLKVKADMGDGLWVVGYHIGNAQWAVCKILKNGRREWLKGLVDWFTVLKIIMQGKHYGFECADDEIEQIHKEIKSLLPSQKK